MQSEIDHLISYIRNSDCTFIRNGKAYGPEEAVQHILKKYDYFRSKIETAEAFIDFCATKSILSNRPYEIGCPGKDVIENRAWLLMELKRFRDQ